jgi:hypothetical protein
LRAGGKLGSYGRSQSKEAAMVQPVPGPTRAAAAVCLVLALSSACATAGKARPTGFLRDYSQLSKPEGDDRAQLTYVNPTADFRTYDMIMIDPVTVWDAGGAGLPPSEEAQLLADDLDDSLRITLARDYRIVEQAGPGVMRLRVALVESEDSWHVRDDVASRFDDEVRDSRPEPSSAARGFVGRAGIEGEMLDGVTGERLLAAVDRRAGARRIIAASKPWEDVRDLFDLWSDRLRLRLAELRGAAAPAADED